MTALLEVKFRGPVKIGDFENGSAEWHAARAQGVGGSEVAMLVGLSPYGGEFKLWHQKIGLYVEDVVNDEMDAGTRLEPAIAEKFRDEHPGWGLIRPAGTWAHPDRPWQIANPDGIVHADGGELRLLETKFSLYGDGFGEPGTDQIPIWYRCQVQWYMDVFDVEVCHLMVFIGSQGRFLEFVIRRDPTDVATLLAAGERFMAKLASGERPPIDGHDTTYEVVKALHPEIDGSSIEVSEDLARFYCNAKAAAKAVKVRETKATALLADVMGSAKKATYLGQPIAARQAKGEGAPYVVAGRNLPVFPREAVATPAPVVNPELETNGS